MAGLVPAIPLRRAQCIPKRGHTGSRACPTSAFICAASRVNPTFGDKPGDDKLMRNRAGNFSVGRLFEFLTALGQDVKITVKPTRKEQGEMELVVG
jgi:hypothetical protein